MQKPLDALGVARDPKREPLAGARVDDLPRERQVPDRDANVARRRRDVPGAIFGAERQLVDAGRVGLAVHAAVPVDAPGRTRQPAAADLPPPDVEQRPRRRRDAERDRHVLPPPVVIGREDAGNHALDRDRRRCRVDLDRVRQRDRLVAQVDPELVQPVRHDSPCRVAPVPGEPDGSSHDGSSGSQSVATGSPSGVITVTVIMLPRRSLNVDLRDVLLAVADGREELVDVRAPDRALLELQPLRDRECRRGPAEQAKHEQDREKARHRRGNPRLSRAAFVRVVAFAGAARGARTPAPRAR